MNNFIGRSSDSQERFFPPISPSLYSISCSGYSTRDTVAIPNQPSPVAVLALADRIFTRWQLWTGRGLDATGQLGRLLWLHRSVLDDELNGRWKQADFYWREILRTLGKMQERKYVWEQLNGRFGFEVQNRSKKPDELRDRVIAELLIDTNCALFNGRLKQAETIKPDDRALTYATYLQELLPLAGFGEDERWLIAEPLADILIKTHQEHGEIQLAIKICEDIARDYPNHWKFQDLIFELRTQSAFAALHNENHRNSNLNDARRLRTEVDVLERLTKTYPYNPAIFESLGLLNQIRAIKLANGDELCEAILAIEESLAYSPDSSQAVEIREQLRTSMKELKTQVAKIEAKIAAIPGAALSADGERLRIEANRGTKAANRFTNSERAVTIAEAVRHARAWRLWQLVGLGGTDEQVGRRAIDLCEALQPLFDENLQNLEELRARLVEVIADIPEIDASMRESLEHHLERLFFRPDSPEEETPMQYTEDPLVWDSHKVTEVPSKEPVGMWLFSKEASSVKVFAAATLTAMMVSGAMAGWDRYERNRRDQAYAQLFNSVSLGEEQAVLRAADEFLSTTEFKADARHSQVDELEEQARMAVKLPQTNAIYEALIKAVRSGDIRQIATLAEQFQVVSMDTPNDTRRPQVEQFREQAQDIAERAKRDEAYERLTQAVSEQDLSATIVAADAFLALPQTYSNDPRTDQVKKVRLQAPELPSHRKRDDSYQDLLAAINSHDVESVMNAAEGFLSAPPIQIVDDRWERVIDAYSRAFVTWFIAMGEPNGSLAEHRIKTYSDLITDTETES